MSDKTKWSIDNEKSEITFDVSPLIFSAVHGSFRVFEADVYTIGNDFSTMEINLRIDPSSISTGDIERDEHLKSQDFFDVKKYGLINFISKRVVLSQNDEKYQLYGELTIKGISREIKLDVEFGDLMTDSTGSDFAEFIIRGSAYRSDWGLVWKGSETEEMIEGAIAQVYGRIMLRKQQNKTASA